MRQVKSDRVNYIRCSTFIREVLNYIEYRREDFQLYKDNLYIINNLLTEDERVEQDKGFRLIKVI